MAATIATKDEQIAEFSQKLVDMESELHKHIQSKQKLKMLSNSKVNIIPNVPRINLQAWPYQESSIGCPI